MHFNLQDDQPVEVQSVAQAAVVQVVDVPVAVVPEPCFSWTMWHLWQIWWSVLRWKHTHRRNQLYLPAVSSNTTISSVHQVRSNATFLDNP